MKPHRCQEDKTCMCSLQALDPDEDCPVHGWPYPPRCGICGRFMRPSETARFVQLVEGEEVGNDHP